MLDPAALTGRRVALVGKLGGVTRREAQQLIRDCGGRWLERPSLEADLIVVGADELPLQELDALLDDDLLQAAAEGRLEILDETQLWQRLGLVEGEQHVRRLYTPAMLAQLLGVSVAEIRRWRRRGLITPVREVRRLPYFDFQEAAHARRLAQLIAEGASPAALERQLHRLARFLPAAERSLAQLSLLLDGRHVLVRAGERLVDARGQARFDFEALESDAAPEDEPPPPAVVPWLAPGGGEPPPDPQQLLELAAELEEAGRLDEAGDALRTALAVAGPQADVAFALAELLYRVGDAPAARERYYQALELDPEFVEARANLGCVLAEEGRQELAAAAFQGALAHHEEYADAHYHLARTLEALGDDAAARGHWARFLELAPQSPWAEEARERGGRDEG